MHISWNWLSEMVDLSTLGGPLGLAELLTRRGIEVEEVHSLSAGFEKVVTAQILERNPHPQADRLSLCKVTTGQGDPLEIVCGAQNMKAGDRVALAQIGANLPNGLKIAQSKIRGVTSNGMLCSEEELKLADKSEGILILPPSTPLGKPLAEILGRDDTVLTLKVTPNRGDCLSHWGVAREVAAALGKSAKHPVEARKTQLLSLFKTPITISLHAGEGAPQFWGCYIEGVKIGPSPAWVVKRLEALGSRSINNVVDATNLLMFELGHPVHAYDADLLQGQQIGVRMAKQGEKLILLDGQEVTLAGTELVIADGAKLELERPVGLAGVMGGGNSEVRSETTRIFLECAEFDPVLVRKASTRHQRKTDAAQRFERGVDPMGLHPAISRLAQLVTELAGGTVKSSSAAFMPSRDPKTIRSHVFKQIRLSKDFCEKFLGVSVSSEQTRQLLAAHDCSVQEHDGEMLVTPPSYRLDLRIKEDLAEEVARSLGYDKIPSTVPPLSTQPRPESSDPLIARFALLNKAKDILVKQGLVETLNYAFNSGNWLAQFGLSSKVQVKNPLSEEHEFLVPSLLPGIVGNALYNWRHHFGSEGIPIRLFELRPTYVTSQSIEAKGEAETGVTEVWKLVMAISGPRYAEGLRNELGEFDFYDFKAILEALFEELGTKGVRFSPLTSSRGGNPVAHLFHPGKSVEILAGNQVAGTMGLLHPGKARELKCRAPLWIAELDWEPLMKLSRGASQPRIFKTWPQFPLIERDFALLIKDDVAVEKITQLALKAGKPLAKVAKVFDIYRGTQVSEGMTSVAVRVIFYDEGRSLQESEADAASTRILETWKKEIGAELRA